MITHRFWLGFVAVLYVIGALYIAEQIAVEGINFVSGLKVLALLSPFFLILLSATESLWMGIMLTTAVLMGVVIPIPLFDRLHIGLVMGGAISLFVLAQNAINKNSPSGIFDRADFKCLLLFFAIVWMRFLIDRPGSARLGGEGGLGEALPMVLSGFVFMALAVAAQRPWPAKANLWIMVLFGIYGAVMQLKNLALYFIFGVHSTSLNCFNPITWTGFAFLLGLVWMWSQKAGRRSFWAYWSVPLCAAATLLFGLLSANRSRPYYALAIILAVAYLMKSFRRTLLLLLLLVVPALFAVITLKPGLLPGAMLRTLSTIAPDAVRQQLANRAFVADIAEGEMGWQNNWRSSLTRLAWEDMKRHPFIGRGFTFGLEQMLSALLAQGGMGMEGAIQGLAVSGGYHNGLLTIAAFCGIPAALAFLIGSLWIYLRFVRQVRRMDGSDFWGTAFAVGLATAYLPNFLQMTINGSGPGIFTCMVYSSVMYGLSYRFARAVDPVPAVEPQRERPVPRVAASLPRQYAKGISYADRSS